MSTDYNDAPIDRISSESLASRGLGYGLVDTTDAAAFGSWLQAEARGFHDGVQADATVEAWVDGLGYRRTTGVWDETTTDPAAPVATVSQRARFALDSMVASALLRSGGGSATAAVR